MTQANVPFNLGKPDLSDRGSDERQTPHGWDKKLAEELQEETWAYTYPISNTGVWYS